MSVPGGTASAVPTAMTDGRIRYVGFEDLDVELGAASDQLALDSTGAVTDVGGGGGDDVIDVETIDHPTRIDGDGGDDTITVNRQPTALPTTGNGIAARLTLDGGNDSDTIEIQLAGTATANIDVLDSGFVGTNRLVVQGTEVVDQFLLRRDLVALLNNQQLNGSYLNAEYVTYDDGIDSLIVNMLGGADRVAIDDNSAITTVNGGDGEDTFQVGQLFGDQCASDTFQGVANACFDPAYIPPTMIDTTQGQLSNGISLGTTLNGGDDNDLFLVFRNRAVLNLNGEDHDDTFVIRTFLEEDSETQVVAGAGADTISYVSNSPVNVNGGDGFDSLFVIGTEADDFFVVTAAGVYGAGRYVAFVAIERLGVDGAEGNDMITVLATPPGVAVEVYGGLGSDTIDIAGDAPVVAADDLTGHSGLITHSIESTNGTWNGRPVDGIAAEVADDDEPALVITQSGGNTVVSESGEVDSYTIALTRAPTTDVRITVLTAELTPDQLDDRERNIQVSLDGVTWLSAVEIFFTPTNWNIPRTVFVRAQHDIAPENAQTTAIQHSVRGEIGGYDELPVNIVGVLVIDDDVSQVVIRQTGLDTVVGESGATDSYTVELSAAPSATVEVRIAAHSDVCLSTASDANADCGDLILTFTTSVWGPVTVTVTAKTDGIVESFEYARLEHTVGATVVGVVTAFVTDRDVPDVLITEVRRRDAGRRGHRPRGQLHGRAHQRPGIRDCHRHRDVPADHHPVRPGGRHAADHPHRAAGRAERRRRGDVAHLRRARVHHRQLGHAADRARPGGRGRRDRRPYPAGVPRPGAARTRDPGVAVRRRRRVRVRLPARQLPAGAAPGRDQLPARHHSERGVRRGRGPRGRPPHRQQPGRRRRPVDDVDVGGRHRARHGPGRDQVRRPRGARHPARLRPRRRAGGRHPQRDDDDRDRRG